MVLCLSSVIVLARGKKGAIVLQEMNNSQFKTAVYRGARPFRRRDTSPTDTKLFTLRGEELR
jgi:hypothetical protein